mmetsp:Transcript_30674/g.56051  ORF Transcript_30674/g.56051 Transcript_30674/m.56051 type:complete len:277 (-) Transcript_30674:110-940(-)
MERVEMIGANQDDPSVVHHDHEEARLTSLGFEVRVLRDGCIMIDLAAATSEGKKLNGHCMHTVATKLPGLLTEPGVQHSNFVQCADKYTQTELCQRVLLTMADRWQRMPSLQQDVYGRSTFLLAKKSHLHDEKWVPLLELFTSDSQSLRGRWDRFRWSHKGRHPFLLVVLSSVISASMLFLCLGLAEASRETTGIMPGGFEFMAGLSAIVLGLTASAMCLSLSCSPLRVMAGQAAESPVLLATRYVIDIQQQGFAQHSKNVPSIFENHASASARWW